MQLTKKELRLSVNGETHLIEADPETPLLYILRNQLLLNGPKYGCGRGQCGACMVLVDGRALMSCITPTAAATEKEILTLVGLAKEDDDLHPVQQSFIEEQAAQCGYCTNGMIISAVALLEKNPNPNDQAIRRALQINLCRCGSQSRVMRAVRRASKK